MYRGGMVNRIAVETGSVPVVLRQAPCSYSRSSQSASPLWSKLQRPDPGYYHAPTSRDQRTGLCFGPSP